MQFNNCGHIFCKECIYEEIEIARSEKLNHIICSFCDKGQNFFADSRRLKESFPKNFRMIKKLENKKQNSNCKHNNRVFLCLDKHCTLKALCCESCAQTSHGNCNHKFLEETHKLKIVLDNDFPDFEHLFDAHKIKRALKSKLDKVYGILSNVIDSFATAFSEEVNFLYQIPNNPKLLDKAKANLDVLKRGTAKYHIAPKKIVIDDWVETGDQFKKSLLEDLPNNIMKSINHTLLDNSCLFKDFKQGNFPKNLSVIDRICEKNTFMISRLHLSSFRPSLPFDFCQYYSGVNEFILQRQIQFEDENWSKLNDQEVKKIKRIIIDELQNNHKLLEDIEDAINARCNRTFKKEFEAKFTVGEFDHHETDKGYSTGFEKSDFTLVVKRNEN